MKNYIIVFLFFNFIYAGGYTQSPNWNWALGSGGNSVDRGQSVFTDPSNGDILVAGFYQSPAITFGSITLNNTLNNFTSDLFVVKYNSAGNILWAKTYGSTGIDRAYGVTVDLNGNVIVTGWFGSPSISFGSTTLTNVGGINCFILKLNSAGNVVWAQQSNGNDGEYGTNVAVDNLGDIVVGGYFKSTSFTFGTFSGSIIGPGTEDVFVVKYNAAGVCQWLNVAGGTKLEDLQGIAVDDNNNVIVCGGFTSAVMTVGATTLTNFQVNTYDAFVIKYTSTGTLSWKTNIGGFYSESALGITTDSNNNIFITGYFESQNFQVGSVTLINNTSSGFLDIYVAKMNATGNFQWAQSCGGALDDYGSAVATDAAGNVLITGYFDSNSLLAGTTTLNNYGSFDIIVAKYTNSGNFVWATNPDGSGSDRSQSIIVNNSGETIITGYFDSNTLAFGSNIITNASDNDIFIAKLDNSTGLYSETEVESWINIYTVSPGNVISVQSKNSIDEIVISNSLGQIVYKSHPKSDSFSVTLANPGIYFVKVSGNGKTTLKKVGVLR